MYFSELQFRTYMNESETDDILEDGLSRGS